MNLNEVDTDSLLRAAWLSGDIEFVLTPQQRAMLRSLERDGRLAMHISRRGGKDILCAVACCRVSIKYPGAFTYTFHHNNSVGREIFKDSMEKVLRTCPKDLKPVLNQSSYKYVWPNGSENRNEGVGTERDIKGGRGPRSSLNCYTEVGLYDPALYDLVMATMEPMLLNQTPGWTIIQSNMALSEDHPFYRDLDAWDGHIVTLDELEHVSDTERERMVARFGGRHSHAYKIECGCARIGTRSHLIVPGFAERAHTPWQSKSVNIEPDPEKPANYIEVIEPGDNPPLVRELDWTEAYYATGLAVDLGFKPDHTGLLIGAARDGIIYVLDEADLVEAHYNEVADAIKALEAAHATPYQERVRRDHPTEFEQLIYHVRRQDGDTRSASSLAQYGVSISQGDNREPRAMDAIINQRVSDGTLVIHPRCVKLIAQLKAGRYNAGFTSYARSPAFGHHDLLSSLQLLVTNLPSHVPMEPRIPKEAVGNPDFYIDTFGQEEGILL